MPKKKPSDSKLTEKDIRGAWDDMAKERLAEYNRIRRDEFAKAALIAVASAYERVSHDDVSDPDSLSRAAVALADAVIELLDRPKP